MESLKSYDNFPIRTVVLSNLNSLTIYALGFLILERLGVIFSFLYLAYILAFEYRLIRVHCTSCYYWGKRCGFGKGRISSLFFKKGDIARFCKNEMTFWDVIPDMLISLIPFIIGIVVLVLKFDFIILSALLVITALTTVGNGFIRGKLTCTYCKQKELGCLAEKLFNKNDAI